MKLYCITTFLQLVIICAAANNGMAQTNGTASAQPDTSQHLSKDQLMAMKAIQTASEKKAMPVALRLGQAARQIYENMLADQENQPLRQELTTTLNAATTELLAIKGQSIRDIINVLTPEQKQLVRREMQKPGAPADLAELIGNIFNVPRQ